MRELHKIRQLINEIYIKPGSVGCFLLQTVGKCRTMLLVEVSSCALSMRCTVDILKCPGYVNFRLKRFSLLHAEEVCIFFTSISKVDRLPIVITYLPCINSL